MNKEILLVVDAVAHEKDVEKEIIFQALEAALASATKKKSSKSIDVCVEINRKTGDYETFRQWQILDDDIDPLEDIERQTLYSRSKLEYPDLKPGDYIREKIDSIAFGRIAVQTAKQVIVQKVREAERQHIIEQYQQRIGEMIGGVVKRIDRGNVILDVGSNVEALINREELIPREQIKTGDRLRGYLKEVRKEQRGPQLSLSRTCPELLVKLFSVEVPEIGEGLIEIKGAARDPGLRAKIAVLALDKRIDPVGACVGMRGSRVQVISNELANERVDIILWDESPAQFVINSMSPAEVTSIVVDEESRTMDVAVEEEQLSLAIGKGGDIAFILANEGFVSIEEVAYVPLEEMQQIEEFDDEIIEELRERAQSVLLTKAISSEEKLEPASDLYDVEGMDDELAHKLALQKILTMEDLAYQSVDELIEIDGIDKDKASALIMSARKPWFAKTQEQ
jgi:N utilization substance protein A